MAYCKQLLPFQQCLSLVDCHFPFAASVETTNVCGGYKSSHLLNIYNQYATLRSPQQGRNCCLWLFYLLLDDWGGGN